MITVYLIVVNVMNGELFSSATLHAFMAIAFSYFVAALFGPFWPIGQKGQPALPIRRVRASSVFAYPFAKTLSATKSALIKQAGLYPKPLIANGAFSIFAFAAQFGFAFWTTGFSWGARLQDAKDLSAAFTNAVPGIFVFCKTTFPTAKTATIAIFSRGNFKRITTPAALYFKSGLPSFVGALARAVDIFSGAAVGMLCEYGAAGIAHIFATVVSLVVFVRRPIARAAAKFPVVSLCKWILEGFSTSRTNFRQVSRHCITPSSAWCTLRIPQRRRDVKLACAW